MNNAIDWPRIANFLNQNWSIIISSVFAFINLIFAGFLYKETKKIREVETEPDISIYLEQNLVVSNVYDIVVKNLGKGAAYKLNFEFDHNAELIRKQQFRKLNELGFFQGIEYFAPNQEYRTWFGGRELFPEVPIEPLTIQTQYTNKYNRLYSDFFNIDPRNYWGTTYVQAKNLNDISNNINSLSNNILGVSNSITALGSKFESPSDDSHQ